MDPQSTESTPPPTQHTAPLPLILSALCALLFASTALLAYQNWQLRERLNAPTTYEACVASAGSIIQESYPATCVTKNGTRFTQPLTEEEEKALQQPDGTESWETYTNGQYGFSLRYPNTYKKVEDPSGWPNAIVILSRSNQQSYDLPIEIWDSEAEYLGTYTIPNHTNNLKVFPFKNGEKYFTLLNTNGDPEVDRIISTFEFINSNTTPPMTACTMDAKICPDGSAVGRSGPNCEFTPCPGL